MQWASRLRAHATRAAALVLLAGALLLPGAAPAFQAIGVWEGAETTIHLGNVNAWWAAKMDEAADAWNDAQPWFRFDTDGVKLSACDDEILLNGVRFARWTCGGPLLGDGTLAVAEWEVDEDGHSLRTGVTFNDDWTWGVYGGDIPEGPMEEVTIDFMRVAIHELGHVLGLGHEDTEPSIMATFVGPVRDVQEDDVLGVQSIYGPPLEEPAPPLDPDVQCQVDQLRAAARLCKKHLQCEGKRVKKPAADPGGVQRDACVQKALDKFRRGWDGAIADAQAAQTTCPDEAPSATREAQIVGTALAVEAAIGAGDPAVRADGKMRKKLMAKAGGLCDDDLSAWEKVARGDASGLAADLVSARAKFLQKGAKAISKGAQSGVAYDGAGLGVIADDVEMLVDVLGASIAP